MPRKLSVSLHIGPHKTATTHFQQILRRNGALMEEWAVGALTPKDLRQPGCEISEIFQLDGPKGAGYEVLDELLGPEANRLILSEENFIGLFQDTSGKPLLPFYAEAEARIAALVEAVHPAQVDVFFSTRAPLSLLLSQYGQMLMGGHYETSEYFFDGISPRDIDWLSFAQRLRAVPGLRQLGVWAFECYPRNLRAALKATARVRVGWGAKVKRRVAHPGMSAAAVAQTLEWAALDPGNPTLGTRARDIFPIGPEWPRYDPFSPTLWQEEYRLYLEQIKAIAEMPEVAFLGPLPPEA